MLITTVVVAQPMFDDSTNNPSPRVPHTFLGDHTKLEDILENLIETGHKLEFNSSNSTKTYLAYHDGVLSEIVTATTKHITP